MLRKEDAKIRELNLHIMPQNFLIRAEGIPHNHFEDFSEEASIEIDAGKLAPVLIGKTLVHFRPLEVVLKLHCCVGPLIGVARAMEPVRC